MSNLDIPFNIDLLELTPAKLKLLGEVSSLDFFDTASGEFHDEGLFSIPIFGNVADIERNRRFGYIDIKATVFHPVVFKAITSMSRFYGEIMAGTRYAIWNPETKAFEPASGVSGDTGFSFFLKHWKQIEWTQTKSDKRDEKIRLIERYKDKALTNKIVVIPAGLRDLEVGPDGRPAADEINDFYRKLLSIANTIPEAALRNNPEIINNPRYRLQATFNELYEFIESLIKGKKKFFMGKWASRRLQSGTRNVITAMIPTSNELGEEGAIGINHTLVGLYQTLVAIGPVSKYLIKTQIIPRIFIEPNLPVRLVNKKTLEMEEVRIKPEDYDRWTTNEGLDKVIGDFANADLRHRPLELEGRYFALIYKGPDNTFKVFHDIRDLPEHFDRRHVHPITFAELLYLSVYQKNNAYPIFNTRYPVSGTGSTYPSLIYIKTTINSESRRELDEAWEVDNSKMPAFEFPLKSSGFYDSITPHTSRLGGMGGDYDGDMISANAVYSDEAVEEVKRFLNSRTAYIGTDGRFKNSTAIPTINLVMFNITGE